MTGSTGARFDSFTEIVITSAALKAGEPPSVTRTVTIYEPGPCPSVGVHVNTPPLVMPAPAGAFDKLNVNVCAGKSASVASALKFNNPLSFTVLFPMAVNEGPVFTSATWMLITSESLNPGAPLSVTTTVTR